jgi:uncharacterized protein
MGKNRLRNLYKQIPEFKCVPGCYACCGPVPLCDEEAKTLNITDGFTPIAHDLICKFATVSGCKVYNDRPLLCRLFGVVEKMQCPKVKASKMLTEKEENKIMKVYRTL